jgi:hypothetical protein
MKGRRFATIEEIAENRRAHQNTSNLCICQKQTKYAIHLKLCTDVRDECTNMT